MDTGSTLTLNVHIWREGSHWAILETRPGHKQRLMSHGRVTDPDVDPLDDVYEALLLAATEAYRVHGHR